MKKLFTLSLCLLIVFSFTACGDKDVANQAPEKTKETSDNKDTSDATEESEGDSEKDLSKDDGASKTDSKENKLSEEKRKEYASLIKEKLFSDFGIDKNVKIALEEYGDFDKDGLTEVVLGLKDPNSENMVSQLLYLKISDDKVELLSQMDVNGMTGIFNCRMVSIKGVDNKMICINYAELEQLRAFALYRLEDNQIILSYTAFPYGTRGDAELMDKDKDGVYEGYETESFAYGLDTYYNALNVEYEFDMGDYLKAKCIAASVGSQPYPDNPKDVILQYACLSELRSTIPHDVAVEFVDKRLKELAVDGYNSDDEYIYDGSLLKNTLIEEKPCLEYDIEISGNKAIAKASVLGEITAEDHVYVNNLVDYELEKDRKTDQWRITNQMIKAYDPQSARLLEALNNPEDEDEYPHADRFIWGDGDLGQRDYSFSVDGQDKGVISLKNELINQNQAYAVVHTYVIYGIDDKENNAFLQNLSKERGLDWYFVEFFDGNHEYYDLGGQTYIMTEVGFNEFMRTGEVVTSEDMQLVACDYPQEDALGKDVKGWHHYIEYREVQDGNPIVVYHGYSNVNETNYYERFTWQRGLGLIAFESGFGAERDVIKLEFIALKE